MLKIKIPNSIIKDVRIGPKTVTGILNKKKEKPHSTKLIKAKGTPLEILNKWEFLKSLKFIEIIKMPLIIKIIENNCIQPKDSLKKIIDNKIVKITEEFEIGAIIPTFPNFKAL